MANIIFGIFRRMKKGLKYKQLVNQANRNFSYNHSGLVDGAKIKYHAQSTFHTVD